MKMHINRRNFLLGTLSTTALTVAPFKVTANTEADHPHKKNYIQCGKINSTDLRHFYYTGINTRDS